MPGFSYQPAVSYDVLRWVNVYDAFFLSLCFSSIGVDVGLLG